MSVLLTDIYALAAAGARGGGYLRTRTSPKSKIGDQMGGRRKEVCVVVVVVVVLRYSQLFFL